MGPPTSSTRFLCLGGHEARTRQYCSGAGGKGARRSCRERRWLLVRSRGSPGSPAPDSCGRSGEPGDPRRSRSRSGFVQGLVSTFPGRSTSRPPPGIFLPSAVGSPAAYMMPGPIRSPSVHLKRVLERDSALRQRGGSRHHRGPRPGGDVRGRVASQEAEPAPSFFITGRRSGGAMLMPDRVPSPARG